MEGEETEELFGENLVLDCVDRRPNSGYLLGHIWIKTFGGGRLFQDAGFIVLVFQCHVICVCQISCR